MQDVQSEVSPRLGSRVAPSLAMSYDVAAERGSQPAQRDELAHSQTVPIGDGVLPLTIDTSPHATTGILESLQRRGHSAHGTGSPEAEKVVKKRYRAGHGTGPAS